MDQTGLLTITLPGQVESRILQRNGKIGSECIQRHLIDGFGQDQPVVLIRAHGLLTATLAPHDDEAATGPNSAGATISNSRENRRRFRSETISPITSTPTPWRRRVRTCAAVSRAATTSRPCSRRDQCGRRRPERYRRGNPARQYLPGCRHSARRHAPPRVVCFVWSSAREPTIRNHPAAARPPQNARARARAFRSLGAQHDRL